MTRETVGKVQSAIGSSVVRRGTLIFPIHVGDDVCQGDIIETGPDGAVEISFNDGTAFSLSVDARLSLDDLVCDPNGIVNSAGFTLDSGALAFSAGRLATTGDLRIDTPIGTICGRARGTGIVTLSLAVLAFSLLRDARDAHALSTDDDTITPKDSEYGTFEIVTRAGTVIQVDDPALTYSVDSDGSVARQPNSSARMEELQYAQQAVLGTYARGLQDGGAGSNTPFEFQIAPNGEPLPVPINFRPLDPIPERFEPVFPPPVEVRLEPPPPPPPAPLVPLQITAFTFDSGIDGDRITNNNALELIGTASPGTFIAIFDGGALIGTTTANGSGTWSFETGPLSDGEHAFTAAAGAPAAAATTAARFAFGAFAIAESNTSPGSPPYIVVIDTKAPAAPVITYKSAGPADDPTDDTTPTLKITTEPGSTVHVYRHDVLVGTATETDTAGIFTFASEELADGCYSFTATATDIANNTSALSCELKVAIDGTAPLAPLITKLAYNCYCPEDNLTDDTTPTLTIAAEAGSTVQVYRDGVWAGTATDTAKLFTSAALADGDYTFTATAADKANNTSLSSPDFAVAIVTLDPNDFDHLAKGDSIVVNPDGTVHGTQRDDTIRFNCDDCDSGQTIYAGAGHDYIKGNDENDLVYGGSGKDRINGGHGDDIMFGGFGNDAIFGGMGNDIFVGGYSADFLSGGKGHETFIFLSVLDSPPCQPDTISTFDSGCDKIDLSAIDADTDQLDNQAFIFAGQTDTYNVVENCVTWFNDSHAKMMHSLADTDGDAAMAEIEIALAGCVPLLQHSSLP